MRRARIASGSWRSSRFFWRHQPQLRQVARPRQGPFPAARPAIIAASGRGSRMRIRSIGVGRSRHIRRGALGRRLGEHRRHRALVLGSRQECGKATPMPAAPAARAAAKARATSARSGRARDRAGRLGALVDADVVARDQRLRAHRMEVWICGRAPWPAPTARASSPWPRNWTPAAGMMRGLAMELLASAWLQGGAGGDSGLGMAAPCSPAMQCCAMARSACPVCRRLPSFAGSGSSSTASVDCPSRWACRRQTQPGGA